MANDGSDATYTPMRPSRDRGALEPSSSDGTPPVSPSTELRAEKRRSRPTFDTPHDDTHFHFAAGAPPRRPVLDCEPMQSPMASSSKRAVKVAHPTPPASPTPWAQGANAKISQRLLGDNFRSMRSERAASDGGNRSESGSAPFSHSPSIGGSLRVPGVRNRANSVLSNGESSAATRRTRAQSGLGPVRVDNQPGLSLTGDDDCCCWGGKKYRPADDDDAESGAEGTESTEWTRRRANTQYLVNYAKKIQVESDTAQPNLEAPNRDDFEMLQDRGYTLEDMARVIWDRFRENPDDVNAYENDHPDTFFLYDLHLGRGVDLAESGGLDNIQAIWENEKYLWFFILLLFVVMNLYIVIQMDAAIFHSYVTQLGEESQSLFLSYVGLIHNNQSMAEEFQDLQRNVETSVSGRVGVGQAKSINIFSHIEDVETRSALLNLASIVAVWEIAWIVAKVWHSFRLLWKFNHNPSDYVAYHALVFFFQKLVLQFSTFSAIKLIARAHPALFLNEMLVAIQESSTSTGKCELVWLSTKFIVKQILCATCALAAFLVKVVAVGHIAIDPEVAQFTRFVNLGALMWQCVGCVIMEVVLQDRLYLFVFGGRDSMYNGDLAARKNVYETRIAHRIWLEYWTDQGCRPRGCLNRFKCIVLLATFNHYDLQKMLIREDDEDKIGRLEWNDDQDTREHGLEAIDEGEDEETDEDEDEDEAAEEDEAGTLRRRRSSTAGSKMARKSRSGALNAGGRRKTLTVDSVSPEFALGAAHSARSRLPAFETRLHDAFDRCEQTSRPENLTFTGRSGHAVPTADLLKVIRKDDDIPPCFQLPDAAHDPHSPFTQRPEASGAKFDAWLCFIEVHGEEITWEDLRAYIPMSMSEASLRRPKRLATASGLTSQASGSTTGESRRGGVLTRRETKRLEALGSKRSILTVERLEARTPPDSRSPVPSPRSRSPAASPPRSPLGTPLTSPRGEMPPPASAQAAETSVVSSVLSNGHFVPDRTGGNGIIERQQRAIRAAYAQPMSERVDALPEAVLLDCEALKRDSSSSSISTVGMRAVTKTLAGEQQAWGDAFE